MRMWFTLFVGILPMALLGQSLHFSLHGGWYAAPFNLELKAADATIYYTLNGSTPRPGATVYKKPIPILKTTVVRAIACAHGQCSAEKAHTFFINEPQSAFPTLSVSVSPDALFNADYGLYREGWMSDKSSWKRPGANYWSKKELLAHAEIYNPVGELVYRDNTGFRLFGGMSRTLAQKSFSLVARGHYGKKRIKYPVFGPGKPEEFKSLVFRNGGSDWGKTHFRDALMISLLDGWDLEKQDHQPCHVYLNGQYWGLYNIREKINRFFIEEATGVDKDSIDLLEHRQGVKKGSAAHYLRMLDYMRGHDLSVQAHFDQVERMMDVDNFMFYQIAQIYFDNQDAGGNIRYWRPRRPDGRWRWIIYDVDQGFGLHNPLAYTNNTLAFQLEPHGPSWPNPPWSTLILRKLLENPGFKQRFIHTFFEVLHTDFAPERVEQRIRAIAELYRPEIPRHFERWHLRQDFREAHIARMITFANRRPDYLRTYLSEMFDLGEMRTVHVGATVGGTLQVGERTLLKDAHNVIVFPRSQPIKLEVQPDLGFRFAGWKGLQGRDWEMVIQAGDTVTDITAVFEPHHFELMDKVIINEIGANNRQSGDWLELYNSSDQAVDVTSWILADLGHQYRLPTAVIPAGGYLVFCQDIKKFKHQFPGVPAVAGNFSFGLNKREEGIYLYTYDGAFVDSVRYSVQPMDTLFTLALLLPTMDNAIPTNWEIRNGVGTPGAGNPHFVESRIRALQAYWLRWGMISGTLLLLLLAGYWRWRYVKGK